MYFVLAKKEKLRIIPELMALNGGVAPYWTVSASGFLIAQILERSIKRNGCVFMKILAFELLVSHLEQSNSGVRNVKAAFAAH